MQSGPQAGSLLFAAQFHKPPVTHILELGGYLNSEKPVIQRQSCSTAVNSGRLPVPHTQ